MNARGYNPAEPSLRHRGLKRRRKCSCRRGRILIVDDAPCYRELVKTILQHFLRIQVTAAATSRQALAVARHRRFDLVISDIARPNDMDGLTFLRLFKRHHPYIPVLIASGNSDSVNRYEAFWSGAYAFLPKPFSFEELLAAVRQGLQGAAECRKLRLRARCSQGIRCNGGTEFPIR